jgi:hypothetical protein
LKKVSSSCASRSGRIAGAITWPWQEHLTLKEQHGT